MKCLKNSVVNGMKYLIAAFFVFFVFRLFVCLFFRPTTRAVSIFPLLGHSVPRLPPGRKPPGPPPGPPPPQVLQMYGRKVGFALDLPPRRRDEDMLYSPELGEGDCFVALHWALPDEYWRWLEHCLSMSHVVVIRPEPCCAVTAIVRAVTVFN